MIDKVYGRVFDSSLAGWIADLIISKEIAQFDSSIAELWEYEAIQDASILSIGDGFLKESSLGPDFVWSGGLLEVSIDLSQDPSINTLFDLYEDVSTYVHNIPQDASIEDLYISKQDNIPDNTFVKESSLGTDFVWNGGLLDVSIISADASVQDLYVYVEDLSAYTYSHTHAQDASITEIYNEIENLPQDASITDLYNYTLDLSTRLDNFDPAQDASIGELFVYVEDLSAYTYSHTHAQDASLEDLYDSIGYLTNWNLSQDASIILKADKTYVDASLNAKQDIIPSGTYVKEASLGGGLVWNAGMLDVSVASSGGVSQEYVDGSLAVQSSWNTSQDASIVALRNTDLSQDASMALKANSSDVYSKTYIDGSLNAKADLTSIPTDFYSQAYVDGSLGTLQGVNTVQDASIVMLRNNDIDIDASIGLINTNLDNIETSLGVINGWNVSQDASIDLINTDISSIESSIGDTTDITGLFLKEASLGTDFYFESGLLEVSIGISDYATLTYVDGSLNILSSWNTSQDASIVLKANLNTSIVEVSTDYTVLSSDNNKVIEADASLVITLPDSLSTGFQITIVNASTGYVSIDASTVLSKGGYKILKDQYSGASAVHKGSGIWYLWGGLE